MYKRDNTCEAQCSSSVYVHSGDALTIFPGGKIAIYGIGLIMAITAL